MKITKRADGRYCCKVTKDGVSKFVYGKTKHEVEEKLKDLSIGIETNKITCNELYNRWFSYTQSHNAPATQKRIKGIADNYILPEFGFFYINNIKPYNIQSLLNKLLDDGRTDTVRKTRQILNSMFELASNNDWINKNPIKATKIPTFRAKEKKPLSSEERKIIEESSNIYKDLFVFLLYTGLRRGEICALKWEDIDLENKTITINKSIDFSVNNRGTQKSTKNGKSRNVPIVDKTYKILASMPHTNDYVFNNQHGNRLTEISLKRMVESIKKDTGVDFTLHQLRHTFCTMLYYSGISSKKAQQIMGHSSLDVTLQIYTHLDEEQENSTLDKLNNFMNKKL